MDKAIAIQKPLHSEYKRADLVILKGKRGEKNPRASSGMKGIFRLLRERCLALIFEVDKPVPHPNKHTTTHNITKRHWDEVIDDKIDEVEIRIVRDIRTSHRPETLWSKILNPNRHRHLEHVSNAVLKARRDKHGHRQDQDHHFIG
ncbi:hypothetical protein DA89_2634 [Vibrio paracholerae]|nr:hypothetical protein DA89_2634 [Vibrio paracholerae]